MGYRPLLFAVLMLVGCIDDGLSGVPANGFVPTTPASPLPSMPPAQAPATRIDSISARATGWLWVMVIDRSGVCIDGAVIEIVSGQGRGFSGKPLATCDAWDWDGGYFLFGLVPGESITIRASAPGYVDGENAFFPASAEFPQASFITLAELSSPPSIPVGAPLLDLRGTPP
jgi:hypothetical protein